MSRVPPFRRLRSMALAILTAILMGVGFAAAWSAPAEAQGWGFFGGLFGGQPQQVQPPQANRRPYSPRRRAAAPRPRQEPKDTEASAPKPPSGSASHFVMVFGDSLGQILANGLDEALSDRPDIAVLHKARDGTGLVRDDAYDWPKAIAGILAEQPTPAAKAKLPPQERIDAAVIMIGSNDRQSLSEGRDTYEPGSDQWTTLYTRRVTAIAEALKKANVPLIWVGVPITRDDAFADAMAALNDIYRSVAAKTGATYVDTWEGFSDDDGDFNTFGPNINGQTVRLRSADGIHFTRAGGLKLAHFVDIHVRRALEQAAPANVPTVTEAPREAKPTPAAAPIVKPDAGPVEVLTQAPVAASGQLGALSLVRDLKRDPLLDTTLVKGEPQKPRQGRADDAAWPPR